MHVLDHQFAEYLHVFHSTLLQQGELHLEDREEVRKVAYLSFLPAIVTGYISTVYGVAIVYDSTDRAFADRFWATGRLTTDDPPPELTIKTLTGTSRIEDLVMGWPDRMKSCPILLDHRGERMTITGPGITYKSGKLLFGERSIVELESVRFDDSLFYLRGLETYVSLRNVSLTGPDWSKDVFYAEFHGNNDAEYWTREWAEVRAHQILAGWIARFRMLDRAEVKPDVLLRQSKGNRVLLFGTYSEHGLARLEAIKQAFGSRRRLYKPVLIRDFPDHPLADERQKASYYGNLARFIIVDDSEPGGQIQEIEQCRANDWITIILRKEHSHSTAMTRGLEKRRSLILELEYNDDNLNEVVWTCPGFVDTGL